MLSLPHGKTARFFKNEMHPRDPPNEPFRVMNPDDSEIVDNAMQTFQHSQISNTELKNKLFGKIDDVKVIWDIITGVLEELGNSVNDWFYFLEFTHIQMFNPYLSKDEQNVNYIKQGIVKRRLRLCAFAVNCLKDSTLKTKITVNQGKG